jgi:hypothetical protein
MSGLKPVPARGLPRWFRILLPVFSVLLMSVTCLDWADGIVDRVFYSLKPTITPENPANYEPDAEIDCWFRGNSYKYFGALVTTPDAWVNTTNNFVIQFNSHCTDVYGYADLVQVQNNTDQTQTGTHRISIMGEYDPTTWAFAGTIRTDYVLTCQGNCEGFEPYAFNYPATWNGFWDPNTEIITGWIDGFGDIKLDTHILLEGAAFRDVPYLDVWP